MSNFSVTVFSATILEHPQADALEICLIGGYKSIVTKGKFKTGDLVAYIPEASVLPDHLIEEMGLTGRLAGSKFNRVKAMRLRGVTSQGLIYPALPHWKLGDDVKDELGITKYEPVIPAGLTGNCMNAGLDRTIRYDIENFKRFPNLLKDGEEVVMTEKCHGVFCGIALLPDEMEIEGYTILPFSKGLGADGLAFRWNHPDNTNNLYCKVIKKYEQKFEYFRNIMGLATPIFILGEIFGSGVQDLAYGCSHGEYQFRVFDVRYGIRSDGYFCSSNELDGICDMFGFERVPVLYKGPFSLAKLVEFTNGKETISGKATHVREGVIVRPVIERTATIEESIFFDGNFGRIQLKSVSDDYLFRKGSNLTEYS